MASNIASRVAGPCVCLTALNGVRYYRTIALNLFTEKRGRRWSRRGAARRALRSIVADLRERLPPPSYFTTNLPRISPGRPRSCHSCRSPPKTTSRATLKLVKRRPTVASCEGGCGLRAHRTKWVSAGDPTYCVDVPSTELEDQNSSWRPGTSQTWHGLDADVVVLVDDREGGPRPAPCRRRDRSKRRERRARGAALAVRPDPEIRSDAARRHLTFAENLAPAVFQRGAACMSTSARDAAVRRGAALRRGGSPRAEEEQDVGRA